MYRVLPVLLIFSLIAFAPAAVPAQDKDKDKDVKVDDKDKKTDDKDKKGDDKNGKEKPAPVEKKNGEPVKKTAPVQEPWYVTKGRAVQQWWPLLGLVLFAGLYYLVIKIRSDLTRLEEQMKSGGGS